MTEITLSVYHIIHFVQLIDRTFQILENKNLNVILRGDNNEELKQMILINSCCQILLLTDSLRDEYKTCFIVKKTKTEIEKDKVQQIRYLLVPVFKKIDEWKDIKGFRDNVLAHNLRNKKAGNKSIFTLNGFGGYNIPQRASDFGFLIQCVDLIKQVIYKIFKKEYIEVDKVINPEEKSNHTNSTKRDYQKEYENLKKEVWKRKEEIESKFK